MELSNMAKIFKALSNEKRLELFKLIYDWQVCGKEPDESIACCGGIDRAFSRACCVMNLSRSTISFHLKELQNAGLILVTKTGQTSSCRVNEEAIASIKEFI
ncbi:MAG: helix-turn-helix transcriptional regulator [Proteobacteria bacterium]|nr:helix-turn-helix transcriptional regulator [Pseudomonadota bacterium]